MAKAQETTNFTFRPPSSMIGPSDCHSLPMSSGAFRWIKLTVDIEDVALDAGL
ncbi:uncharacterized protein LAESUDRAFT_765463 [Laetiporus sulphureus 93-53]|uniref:Uncharacterized protein n=1 Tax=Laetiporus sulphureus 93-53 TaxID=1314785 RepID=A0A165AR25_9APHY|nr:uncharacterized protein LAESUDRAFT_765463 [Laetiporus sulphureus 93-53]KZS99496.1 hypothetical protein LAESUDRAFT_765463 [Laetiporus sulphureus 93-53]